MKKKDISYLFLILIIWILYFHRELFSGYFIFLRDIKSLYFPYKSVITNIFSKGEFPFWNQYLNCGEPILSNPQYMLFYPGYFLFYLTNKIFFFQFHFLIHILIGTYGFYFFSKKHLKNRVSAFSGSILYGFSGFSISHLLFQNMVVYIGLLPWLLISLRKLYFKKGWKNSLLLAILVVLMIFSIEPYYFIFSIIFGGLYLFYISKYDLKKVFNLKKEISLAILFTILFGSIQIIPALYLLKISPRGKISPVNKYHLETNDIFNIFVGNYYGNYLRCDVTKIKKDKFMPFFLSFYFGAPAIFLFLLGLFRTHRKKRYFIIFTILILLGISYGGVLFKILEKIPPFNMGRYSVKFFFPIFFIITIFFSKGIDFIFELKRVKNILIPLIISVLSLFLIFITTNYFIKFDSYSLKRINKGLFFQFIFLSILSLIIFIMKNLQRRKEFLLTIFFIVTILSIFQSGKVKYSIKKKYFLRKPFYTKLFKNSEKLYYRISPDFSKKYLFLCGTKKINPYFYAIEGCDDFLPSYFNINEGFLVTVEMLSDEKQALISSKLFKNEVPVKKLLNFLPHTSVKYLVSQKPIESKLLKTTTIKTFSAGISLFYYEFKKTPAIFHFSKKPIETVGNDFSFLFKNYDDREIFYLPESEYEMVKKGARHIKNNDVFNYKIKILSQKIENNMFKFHVKSDEKSFLILNEFHYPGWKAFIDGKEVKNFKVNLIFQGVILPEGDHTVIFRYYPPGFKISLILFSLGIVLIIFLWFYTFLKKKENERKV